MNLMTKKICANVCAAVMSITAVGICGELLLDNKSVGAEKAPAAMCKDNNIPILVFDLARPDNIYDACMGENIGTLVK